MKFRASAIAAALLSVIMAASAVAKPVTVQDGFVVKAGKGAGIKADSIQIRSVGGTGVYTLKAPASNNNNRDITLPDPGASGSFMTLEGAQSVTGVKTFNDGSAVVKAGTGSESLLPSGIIDTKVTTTGTAADTNETDGYSFSVPGNSLNANGKALELIVWGTTSNQATNKTVKLYWNGVAVFTSGTTSQNKDWWFKMIVMRDSSGTQRLLVTGQYNDAIVVPVTTTGSATDTGAIIIKNTMTNGTANANDIQTEGAILRYMP